MSQLATWKTWEPLREFNPFRNMIPSNLFDDLYSTPGAREMESLMLTPKAEVQETPKSYQLRFDLPGLSKEHIQIDVSDNTLTLTGERHEEKSHKNPSHRRHFSEISYGHFSRTLSFPEHVDEEKTSAHFENGVLFIEVPKKEGLQKRRIPIR